VIKIEGSVEIVGKDRVRKKHAYTFHLEGGSGAVVYKIGEEGEWKTLLPGPEGEYVIPKGEITDTVWIERR